MLEQKLPSPRSQYSGIPDLYGGASAQFETTEHPHAAESAVDDGMLCACCTLLVEKYRPRFSGDADHPAWLIGAVIAVGLLITMITGGPARAVFQRLASTQTRLRTGPISGTSAAPALSGYDILLQTEDVLNARQNFETILARLAVGVGLVFIGLGTLARTQVRRHQLRWMLARSGSFPRQSTPLPTVLAIWGFADSILLAFARVLLSLLAFSVVVRLLSAEPPTWNLLDRALSQTIDGVVNVARILS